MFCSFIALGSKYMYFFIMLLAFFLLYKHNLFYFCPFLNMLVTAVFQNTCFVFSKSLHHKQISFLAVLMSLWPVLVLPSQIPPSWSAFFRLISFPPYHSRLYWGLFSPIPFSFYCLPLLLDLQSLLFLLPGHPRVIRCLWCRMSVSLILSESLCGKEKDTNPHIA